jgi:hypothetical protein
MIFLVSLFYVYAGLCTKWDKPREIGLLPYKTIDEASGIQFSKKISDRLYHINDSGDGPFFYITDTRGENLKSIKVDNFYPKDVEDLTLATYDDKDYIVIADIGDNLRFRESLQLIFIEEKSTYPTVVTPAHVLNFTYPKNEKHNSEAIAFHPNGDLYLFTKEEDVDKGSAFPFHVYKIPKEVFLTKKSKFELIYVATIDLPKLLPKQNWLGKIVTAMDIDKDGNWILLTYKQAIYSNLDLTKPIPPVEKWKLDQDYTVIDTLDYPQQEAIAFVPGTLAFVISTEYKKKYKKAPISRLNCIGSTK